MNSAAIRGGFDYQENNSDNAEKQAQRMRNNVDALFGGWIETWALLVIHCASVHKSLHRQCYDPTGYLPIIIAYQLPEFQ